MVTGAYYLAVHLRRVAAGDPRRPRGLALHADVGPDPRAAPDPDPPVPARVAGVGARRRQAGTLKRPSFGGDLPPECRRTTIVTTLMFACSYGVGVRRDPAHAADRARPRRGQGPARGPQQQKIVSAVQCLAGDGRAGRALRCSRSWRCGSWAAARLLRVFQVPGLHRCCRSCSLRAAATSVDAAQVGHLPGRARDRRPVQLLGELPAARLPDAPARHGRELRRQRRRPHDRHLGGARDHLARQLHAGSLAGGEARLVGRGSWDSPCTWSASPRASSCPSRSNRSCRIDASGGPGR